MLKQNGFVRDSPAQRVKSRVFRSPDPLAFTQVSQQVRRIFDINGQGRFGGKRGESKDLALLRQEKISDRSCTEAL